MAMDFDALVLGPCMGIFGSPTVYQPNDGSASFPLTGVFDRFHAEITFDDSTGAPISTMRPILGVRASDFPAGMTPGQGDKVTVAGETYLVMDKQPDGQGHVLLILKIDR